MGLDSAGKPLDRAMPRYRMTHGDLADLVAYLMVIGRESDPGLSADRIRIGVIVAPSRLFPEMGLAVRAALTAFVSEINRAGGVYQREIELCFSRVARAARRPCGGGNRVCETRTGVRTRRLVYRRRRRAKLRDVSTRKACRSSAPRRFIRKPISH